MSADKKKALYLEATQHIKAGKYGQASKVLKELMALEPSNIEYRRLSASLNLKLGNMISAMVVYDSLVREAMHMRDFRLAESLLRDYLAAGPRYVPFLELLGRVCEENNNAMVAANEYGKALQILMEDADPGEAAHAADLYERISTLAPNNPVLLQYDPAKFSRTAPAPRPMPLETALRMSAPSPAAAPPPVAQSPTPSAPTAPPPAAAEEMPLVEDDVTGVLASSGQYLAKPPLPIRDIPPSPPMVEDDLTEILSKPIPKRPPLPKRESPPPVDKPSLAKTLFGFLQSSPTPESAPPPAVSEVPPPAAAAPPAPTPPVETTSAALPQWKPWEPEEPAVPEAEPAAAEPAPASQGTEWKPWQPPEPEAAAPAQDTTPAGAAAPPGQLGTGLGFLVVDSRKEPSDSVPALERAFDERAPIPARGRAAAPPLPRRTVAVRRTGGLAKLVKTLVVLAVVAGGLTAGAYGALVLSCLLLEKSPSEAYRNFISASPPVVQNPRKNAYLLLLGFDAEPGRDPMVEGYERAHQPATRKRFNAHGTSRRPRRCASRRRWLPSKPGGKAPIPSGSFRGKRLASRDGPPTAPSCWPGTGSGWRCRSRTADTGPSPCRTARSS
jgi:hypothetical protein